ncbi:tetratricopeptide repeat protein [Mariniphaga sp.]|uniref:tetratricopeptide repeat protein n=1 Tax=Mariniphaga sp. TaxID=1954475 RepID=UPI003566819F
MIPKTKHFEWIEDYLMDALSQTEKKEFETELQSNSQLSEEVKFEKEVQSAITEKDVLNLREKLETVSKQIKEGNTPFNLLDGFENIQQLSETLPPEELLKFYDSLPKAHVYQHEMVSNENIHEFFREQNIPGLENDVMFDDFDEGDIELEGLEEAILEKDILNLRNTLVKVSASVREQCSADEIDRYLNGELIGKELERFEQELAVNSILQREVAIHRELESALLELDVMNLRDEISHLMETETSWNVTEVQIEDFISGSLEGEELEMFQAELNENTDLKAEVALRRNIDLAVGEKDVLSLRDKLQNVQHDVKNKEIKSLIPDTKVQQMNWWRAGVAVAVVLFAFAGIFRNEFGNINHTYNQYYEQPEWAPQRSVTSDLGFLQQANGYFVNGEYEQALLLYDKAIKENDEKFVFQFYKAASLQNLEKFEEAIPEYSKVIEHGDNMFVEEAEWYKALCYLKLERKDMAKEQLLAIINRNGYYAGDAKAILRKTRFLF